jgi:PAS domain S-box-containing protein
MRGAETHSLLRELPLVTVFSQAESVPVIVTDRDETVLFWNRGAELSFGYPSAEMVGQGGMEQLMPAEDVHAREQMKRACSQVLSEGKPGSCKARYLTRRGTVFTARVDLLPVTKPDGWVSGILSIIDDVSDDHRRLFDLISSRDQFKTLLQILPDIVYLIDAEGKFAYLNKSIRTLGYEPDDLIGHHFSEIVHPDDYQKISREQVLPQYEGKKTGDRFAPKLFDERRTGDRKTENLEVRLMPRWASSDDESRVVIISAVHASGHYGVFDQDSLDDVVFLGTIGVIRDITDRKIAEEEQHRLEAQLHQARKMEAIGQLAGGIAHDFNNMLSGISGYAEVIKRRNRGGDGEIVDSKLDAHIQAIVKATERASGLTAKLLAFARHSHSEKVAINLHDTIKDVTGLLKHAIDRRVDIQQQLGAEHAMVMGDPTQLENAILNLGMNAVDAMPHGGTLTFGTRITDFGGDGATDPDGLQAGRYLAVTISDTGIGMDQVTQQRAFEPFFTTKEPGDGTGLGLPSVHGTIKSHRGAIQMQSEPGGGTVFTVFLPLHDLIEASSRPPDVTIEKGIGRIMVVDDEEIVRGILGHMLDELGYEGIYCTDGADAVACYRRHYKDVDLVILDMNMPVMNGYDCLKELRRINADVKVVVITGYTTPSAMRKITTAGVAGFVQKPFKLAEMSSVISGILKEQAR